MKRRKLGSQGLEVREIGLGCMSMTGFLGMATDTYGPADETECVATLERAVALGVELFDTAETYGPLRNEELLGRVLSGHRKDVVLATKFGFDHDPTTGQYRQAASGVGRPLNSRPESIRTAVEGMLGRLRTDVIDVLYQHRLDPHVPIEDTVGAMSELVRQGKVRFLGLSEVGSSIIRRAHAVHPISVVQSEYSIWERAVERDPLPTLRELGIGFVAYSPLGRGFLTGTVNGAESFHASEYRHLDPRMQGDALRSNQAIVDAVRVVATEHGATPAQVALAWVLARGSDILPIPGTKRRLRLEENVAAAKVSLSAAEVARLDAAGANVRGKRYPDVLLGTLHSDAPSTRT